MLANKKTEHWILWIVANSISIPLYLTKGLGFTAIQYSVFLVLAIQGWYIWQKKLKKGKIILDKSLFLQRSQKRGA
jgi:nicotinamide mononucleotide transporter